MSPQMERLAIPLLRWTLGLVVVWESYRFAVSSSAAHFLVKAGLPQWVAPVLGGAEIVAAILFLIPVATVFGGYLLLFIFAIAALLHILHGAFDVSGLLVYSAAVFACISHSRQTQTEAAHD